MSGDSLRCATVLLHAARFIWWARRHATALIFAIQLWHSPVDRLYGCMDVTAVRPARGRAPGTGEYRRVPAGTGEYRRVLPGSGTVRRGPAASAGAHKGGPGLPGWAASACRPAYAGLLRIAPRTTAQGVITCQNLVQYFKNLI